MFNVNLGPGFSVTFLVQRKAPYSLSSTHHFLTFRFLYRELLKLEAHTRLFKSKDCDALSDPQSATSTPKTF
jgi:hypothetical protein